MNKAVLPIRGFDVAIFVATSDEEEAVRDQGKWIYEISPGGFRGGVWVHHLRTLDNHIIRMALRKLPDMGAEDCILDVSRFLSLHPCRLVAMVGVCAGAVNKGLKGGDIVVPGMVESISNGKRTPGVDGKEGFRNAGRSHRLDEKLREAVANFSYMTWPQVAQEIVETFKIAKLFPQSTKPRLHHGTEIVMGQVFHVLAYPGAVEELQEDVNRRIAALEMESAALAYAAESADRTPWIIIKGVQDDATITKDDRYRKCGAWGSYHALTGLVSEHLGHLWLDKKFSVRQIPQGVKIAKAQSDVITKLHDLYRAGQLALAHDVGTQAMTDWPYDSRIWMEYLKVLMRLSDYDGAADLIDVADYYLQADGFTIGDDARPALAQYKIRRAEYYLRVGHVEVAIKSLEKLQKELDGILKKQGKEDRTFQNAAKGKLKDLYVQLSEVHYLLGRAAMMKYHYHRSGNDLNVAHEAFFQALEIARKLKEGKYWIFFAALFVRYVRDSTYDQTIAEQTATRIELALSKKGQETRPAPRIYRLRALMIEAANSGNFERMAETIDQDKKDLKGKLFIPADFFRDFEQDCRLVFKSNFTQRDRALSMIYDWAAEVRK